MKIIFLGAPLKAAHSWLLSRVIPCLGLGLASWVTAATYYVDSGAGRAANTGLDYRHEPALVTIEMVNETSLLEAWCQWRLVGRDDKAGDGRPQMGPCSLTSWEPRRSGRVGCGEIRPK